MGNTVFAGAGLGAARVLGEPVLVVEAFARGNLVEGACELVPCVRPKQAIGVPELAGNLVQRSNARCDDERTHGHSRRCSQRRMPVGEILPAGATVSFESGSVPEAVGD